MSKIPIIEKCVRIIIATLVFPLVLLNLSSQTQQIIVEDSWHSIQIPKPDMVISAVKSLMNDKPQSGR
ncbi:hypothetical protein D3C73_663280 [compost metagenome]